MTRPGLLDAFIARPDVRERHDVMVRAPADQVFDVAAHFDLQSIPLVRAIFRARTRLLGAHGDSSWTRAGGLVAETAAMGWGVLVSVPGRAYAAGAVTRPWEAAVKFHPLPPEVFATYTQPGAVRIAWTIEVEPVGPDRTRLITETRVSATDEASRRRFRRYWRIFGAGILLIRWLALPAIRRQAEARYRHATGAREVLS